VLSLAIGLSVFTAGVTGSIVEAAAQASAETLSLTVPPAFQLVPGVETPLPIQIKPSGTMPRRAIVLIRGLPSTVTLSDGRLFESGVWGVPAADLAKVKMLSSETPAGRTPVTVSVVAIDGTLLAEANGSLIMAESPADLNDKTIFTAAPAQDLPAERDVFNAPPRPSPAQSEQLFSIVRKGDEQMAMGNVSAARLLYRHAADNGLAAAALALAASYDEEELRKRRVKGGVQPDSKQAQFWYEKARELGSAEARERLLKLGAR
jgi:hypothetical protein